MLVEITLRNVAHIGLPWITHLSRELVLYVALLGAVIGAARGRHIRVDVLHWLSPGLAARLERPMSLFAAIVCAGISAAAARFFWSEWQLASPGMLPVVAAAAILPVGFGLLALRFLLRTVAGSRA